MVCFKPVLDDEEDMTGAEVTLGTTSHFPVDSSCRTGSKGTKTLSWEGQLGSSAKMMSITCLLWKLWISGLPRPERWHNYAIRWVGIIPQICILDS